MLNDKAVAIKSYRMKHHNYRPISDTTYFVYGTF